MAFPVSPTLDDEYEKWTWNGTGWEQTQVQAGVSNPLAWQTIMLVHTLNAVANNPAWVGITYV